jgi:capsular polysaccharide transport system permease protein
MMRETFDRSQQLVLLEDMSSATDMVDPTARRRDRLLLAIFLLIGLCAALYNFVIATPRYSSEFTYVVRSLDSSRERFSILNVAASGGGADNSEAIVSFIESRDMLTLLNQDGLITRMFARDGIDPFSAFPSTLSGSSKEDLYRHFQHYVHASFDRATNITHVEVEAFTPAEARQIAERIMQASERMVNSLNGRARTSLVESAQREVNTASQSLSTTLDELNETRNRLGLLDSRLEGGAAIKNSSAIASALAQSNVELAQTMRVAPNSPAIGQLRARRAALEAELSRQISATAGSPRSLANRTRPYEELNAQREIGEKRLLAASLVLASARANASRTQLYVERISQPSLPDEPRYPRAWRNLLITLALALGVLWIVRSLSDLFLEHD